MTNPPRAMPPLPEPSFEFPSLCRFNGNEMESYAKAYAAPLVARVAELQADAERVRLLTEVETTGEGLRYSLDCLVNNGVNTFRVCDEENNEYLGDDWLLDPVQAIDAALAAKD